MCLALTIARRSLFGQPGRTAFSILGVAVGIATVVAVFTVDHVSVLSRTAGLDPSWGADLEVKPGADVDQPREELLGLEGVAGVAAFFENDMRFRPVPRQGADNDPVPVQLVALDAGSGPSLGVYHVDVGSDLDPNGRGDDVLIGRALAEGFGLAPGDSVYLAPPTNTAKKRCVDGTFEQSAESGQPVAEEIFRVAGVLAYEGIGRKAKGGMVVIDYAAGRRMFRDVHIESQFWVRRDAAVELERLESNLSGGFTFQHNQSKAVGQMADERAFRNGVRLAGLFALLLGLFVIFHTLSMSLVERVREVGALHALGTTQAQLARVFFVEALAIAIAAGVTGVVGGILLARLLLYKGITTLGVQSHPVTPFELPWKMVLTLTLLGVSIALLGSVYPILKARGTNVIAILRGEDVGHHRSWARGFQWFSAIFLVAVVPALFFFVVPVVGASSSLVGILVQGIGVLTVLIGLLFLLPSLVSKVTSRIAGSFESRWPLAGKIASRSLQQSPTRIGASVAAIALVTAAFIALKGMTNSISAEVEEWADRAVVDKVWMRNLPEMSVNKLTRVMHELPEVLGVEPGGSRVRVGFLMIGLRPGELTEYGPLAKDPSLRRALEQEQGIIVSERLAQQRELKLGDTMLVNTSGHGLQEFRVLAISDEYGYFVHPDERAYGITSDRYLQKYFCIDVERTTNAAVRLREGTDPGLVYAHVRDRFSHTDGMKFNTGRSVVRLHLEDIQRDFVLFDIILFLTALLAGLGVLNGQLLAALERRKELGVLRALGMTREQVAGSVLLESGVIGLCGGLLGLAVGSALTPVVVSSLRVLSGLALPLRWAGPYLGLCLAGALVLALVAGLYPIWRMNRMDAVRAVRTG